MFIKSVAFSLARALRCALLAASGLAVLCSLGCSGTSRYVLHTQAPSAPSCWFVIRDKQDGEVCAVDGKAGKNKYSFWTMNPFPVVPGEGRPDELRFNNESSGTFQAELASGPHSILVKPWDGFSVPKNIPFECAPNKTYSVKMTVQVVGTTGSKGDLFQVEHGVWQATVVEVPAEK